MTGQAVQSSDTGHGQTDVLTINLFTYDQPLLSLFPVFPFFVLPQTTLIPLSSPFSSSAKHPIVSLAQS